MRESNSQVLEIGAVTRKRERERERGECVGSFTVFFGMNCEGKFLKRNKTKISSDPKNCLAKIKEKITGENVFFHHFVLLN